MKKLLASVLVLIFTTGIFIAHSQVPSVRFTLKPGSNASSAKVFVRSDANLTGVVSQTLMTFTIPASITPIPNASITMAPAFSHLSQTGLVPTTEIVNGVSSTVYTFFSAFVGTTTNTLTANIEQEFAEIQFGYNGVAPAEIKLASLPDGGSSTVSYLVFEVGGFNYTIEATPLYGPGAVNGGSYSSLSFLPLNVTLPVKFLSFYAMKNEDNARLNWTVEGDDLNKHFEVERSLDGRTYRKVTLVPALDNGKTTNTYEATDAGLSKLGSNSVFYRIKQVDKSGEISYSQIRNLNTVKKGTPVTLFPNPAKTITKLTIDTDNPGRVTILIRDAGGRLAKQMNVQVNNGMNQFDLNIADLASGEYITTVSGDGFSYQLKFAKIN